MLVPRAEVRHHGIQLVREQVTSASRTALVTPYHTLLRTRETVGLLGRLSLCQEQAVGPSQPQEQRWQPDTASTGELVAREWHKQGFPARQAPV